MYKIYMLHSPVIPPGTVTKEERKRKERKRKKDRQTDRQTESKRGRK